MQYTSMFYVIYWALRGSKIHECVFTASTGTELINRHSGETSDHVDGGHKPSISMRKIIPPWC